MILVNIEAKRQLAEKCTVSEIKQQSWKDRWLRKDRGSLTRWKPFGIIRKRIKADGFAVFPFFFGAFWNLLVTTVPSGKWRVCRNRETEPSESSNEEKTIQLDRPGPEEDFTTHGFTVKIN